MTASGDAAEQVVRMSLEGMEVTAKIAGLGAKNTALLLAAVLKEEQKTKGKARLTSMLRSGKELKVFSVRQKDLKRFSQEAKRYGVLYCVLKDRNNRDENVMVDIIARADDASKIQRIVERFQLSTIDKASVMSELQKDEHAVNPTSAKTGKEPLSEPDLKQEDRSNGSSRKEKTSGRTSVREKLAFYQRENERAKELMTPEAVREDARGISDEVNILHKGIKPKEKER